MRERTKDYFALRAYDRAANGIETDFCWNTKGLQSMTHDDSTMIDAIKANPRVVGRVHVHLAAFHQTQVTEAGIIAGFF